MDRENFAGDEERLQALIDEIANESVSTIDQSFISEHLSEHFSDHEDENDVPTTDEEDYVESEPPSEPDDTDEDMDYVQPSDEECSDDSTYHFMTSTPKKRKLSQGKIDKLSDKYKRRPSIPSQLSPIPVPCTSVAEEMVDDPDVEEDPNYQPDQDTDPETNMPVGRPLDEIREEAESDPEDDLWEEVGSEDDFPLRPVTYNEVAGPKHMPPPDSPPISYFNLFFTNLLLQSIVRETNRYATQCLERSEFSDHSRTKKWLPTCIPEIKGFIACIINMGLIRKPTIFSYWSTLPMMATPWLSEMFSRDRFQLILCFFHLVNNNDIAQRNFDPCAKFQPLVDHANILFRHHYTPHEQLSVDESLIGTKSHTVLQQYLPKKQHHRWGVKVWMLCDSVSNYVLGFFVYKGARVPLKEKQEQKEFGQGFVVVKKLLTIGNYLNKGFHVYTDNFFASISLATRLYELGTYYTATIRSNRKGLPDSVKRKYSVGVTKFYKNGFLLLCGFRDKKSQKKQVFLISTAS